jgi:hypothetical protein
MTPFSAFAPGHAKSRTDPPDIRTLLKECVRFCPCVRGPRCPVSSGMSGSECPGVFNDLAAAQQAGTANERGSNIPVSNMGVRSMGLL